MPTELELTATLQQPSDTPVTDAIVAEPESELDDHGYLAFRMRGMERTINRNKQRVAELEALLTRLHGPLLHVASQPPVLPVLDVVVFVVPDEGQETISDGFGSSWSAYCCMCGQKTMFVVRPGKVECDQCG